jgi:hypothetical protein
VTVESDSEHVVIQDSKFNIQVQTRCAGFNPLRRPKYCLNVEC